MFGVVGDLALSHVPAHGHDAEREQQIAPLRFASVGMTKYVRMGRFGWDYAVRSATNPSLLCSG
jgi:hypothetical protein